MLNGTDFMNAKKVMPILFLLLILFFVVRTVVQKKELRSNFIITSGKILELGNSRNSGARISFKYFYFVNGLLYNNSASISCSRKNSNNILDLLMGQKIIVVYQKNKPDNSDMLIERESFDKYKLSIPGDYKPVLDSLEKICLDSGM